jgi:nucleoside-diphosphate-sugar epimerase
MRILINTQASQESQLLLLFGLGLIGSAISSALLRLDFRLLADIPFEWHDDLQISDAHSAIESLCQTYAQSGVQLSIVWSAGKAGFHSPQCDADQEFTIFQKTVRFASKLREKIRPAKFSFQSVSSAGGLFEGQRVIRKSSNPSPIRPYGVLKKQQEDHLFDAFDNDEIAIYRPSSVYGPMTQKSRLGLINNLINNARNGRITVIDAHVMSLRDYVFAGDIGNYIGRRIRFGLDDNTNEQVHFLVSAKCSSIFEVFAKIKRILNLHAQFRLDDQFGNHKNITFSDSVLPPGWRPVTLDVGIRQFMIGR